MTKSNELRILRYVKSGAKIGHHVFMDEGIDLDPVFPELIEIEDFVVISSGVRILTHDGSACNTFGYYNQKGKVKIERNSFIGANSIILPSVTIGKNSVVGAGSVVTKNVPPGMVVAGNPAKIIEKSEDLLKKRMNNSKYENFIWRSPYLSPENLNPGETKLTNEQFSLFKSYINGDLFVEEYPKYLVIESTNYCNFNCIMCPRKHMTRKIGHMDFNLFKRIIDEIEGKVEFIYLHFFGEPLLHKRIFEFIDYASGKGMTVSFSTNASLLNEELAEKLLYSGLDLLILSIDSLSDQTYQKIRDGGNFEQTMMNVDRFLKKYEHSDSTLNISLQMIKMSLNEHEVEHFMSRWDRKSGLNSIVKPLHNYADQVQNIGELGNFSKCCNERSVCVEPWRGMVIGWDGIVVPCCNDFDYRYVLGDLKKQSLYKIWNSEEMQTLRKLHRKGEWKSIEICKQCPIPVENYLDGLSLISKFNPSRLEVYSYYNKGLYQPEVYPEYDCIWTEKQFELLIQDKFKDVRITFCNHNPNNEYVDVEVKLFNKKVGIYRVGKREQIFLQTPENLKGRLLRYEFVLSDDWVPQECGVNEDKRRLGLMIENILN